MKRNKFLKAKLSFLVLISLAFVVVGCAKDQTLDEYHQERVNQDVTRLQTVSGKYTGTMTNQVTQASMGSVEIDLGTALVPVSNADDTQMTTEAELTGTVTLNSQGAVQISQFAYISSDNATTGQITGKISIDSGAQVLDISGTLTNGTLTGVITSDGTSATTVQPGQFVVSIGGPAPGTASLSAAPVTSKNTQHEYTGVVKDPSTSPISTTKKGNQVPSAQGVVLTIRPTALTPQELFFQAFSQTLNVTATLVFNHTEINTGEAVTDNQVSFTAVSLDIVSGSFQATGTYAGNVNTPIGLNCSQGHKFDPSATWNCNFYSAQNGVGENFAAVAQN
jgi:hypothetical protein